MSFTNSDRADCARAAVEGYINTEKYGLPAGEDTATIVRDLITDLLHLYEREADEPDTEFMLSRLEMYVEEREEMPA